MGFVVDENLNSDVKAKFDEILDSVSKELKESSVLHTLALSKVKDKVVYPESFKEDLGEDVREFEEARPTCRSSQNC